MRGHPEGIRPSVRGGVVFVGRAERRPSAVCQLSEQAQRHCLRRSDTRAAADEMPDKGNRRHDQQRMNQPAGDVKHDKAEHPAHQKDKEENKEHGDPQRHRGGSRSQHVVSSTQEGCQANPIIPSSGHPFRKLAPRRCRCDEQGRIWRIAHERDPSHSASAAAIRRGRRVCCPVLDRAHSGLWEGARRVQAGRPTPVRAGR
jgi:hypothetical protein